MQRLLHDEHFGYVCAVLLLLLVAQAYHFPSFSACGALPTYFPVTARLHSSAFCPSVKQDVTFAGVLVLAGHVNIEDT